MNINLKYGRLKIINFEYIFLLKIIIFIILSIYFFIKFNIKDLYKNNLNIKNGSEIFINQQNIIYLKAKIINKFNLYIKFCKKGIFKNYKYNIMKIKPKITITMPIYNGGKYLYYSLRSIQNQKMKDIEIVLIDDCSLDNSLNLIKLYMKQDKRIRLIQNYKNRKILYSKSLAALNAKGKYIIQIDQDDMFIRDDIFDILYSEAESNNLDLVQMETLSKKIFYVDKKTKVHFKGKNNIITQPELKDNMYIKNKYFLLWGKLIKADLYKKSIYHLWPIIMNYKLIFQEDFTISLIIVILAKKSKNLNVLGLFHLIHSNEISYQYKKNKEYYLSILFFANILYEYYIKNHPNDIHLLVSYINSHHKHLSKCKKLYPNLFYYIIKNIIISNYLSKKKKLILLKKYQINNNKFQKIFSYKNIMNDQEYFSILFYQNSKVNKKKKELNIYIKISIIIYCNQFLYLEKTIKSIENQNFKDFEIILIYDNNEKKDFNNIKNYIKKFKNIILINNLDNKGIIYSLSKGVLSSRGEYILVLQSCYTLSKNNILENIFNIISKEDLDILEFDLLVNKNDEINKNSLNLYKCLHYKSNINLTLIKYNINYKEIDLGKEMIFNKLVKAYLFKNIIIEYNFANYTNVVYNYFDNIFLFSLFKKKIKFRHYSIKGLIQNFNNNINLSLSCIMNDKKQKFKDSIFYINFLYEQTGNSFEEKKLAVEQYFNILSSIYNKFQIITNESYKLFQKFMNSKYISNFDKKNLAFYYNSLIN